MAQSPTTTGPIREDDFLADRERFWHGWTHFTVGAVIFLVLLLVAMAVFLLYASAVRFRATNPRSPDPLVEDAIEVSGIPPRDLAAEPD